MPPKAAASSSSAASAVLVGRPRAAASEDPALELKRQKAREAAAKYRAKKSSAMSSTSAAASSSAPVNQPLVMNKSLLKGFAASEEKKAKAKGVLTSAVQGNKARDEMRKLKEAKLQADAAKYMEKRFGVKKGDDFMPLIKLPYKDFRRYLKYQFPEHWNFIKKYQRSGDIEVKYKPYRGYNYFGYMYKDDDGKMKEYPIKIEVSVDEDYANYLADNFWRYDYWLWRNSQGYFPYDVLEKPEVKNDQYFEDELFLKQFPVPEYETGSPPAIDQKENEKKVEKKQARFFDDIKHRRDYKFWEKYYAPIYKREKFSLGTRDRLEGVMSVPTSPNTSRAVIKRDAKSMR